MRDLPPRLVTAGLSELLQHHLGLRADDARNVVKSITTEYQARPRTDLTWHLAEPERPVFFRDALQKGLDEGPVNVRHAAVYFARFRRSDVPGVEVVGPTRLLGFDGAEAWTWRPELPRYDWREVVDLLQTFELLPVEQREGFLAQAPWWSIVLPDPPAVALYPLADSHTLVVARDAHGFPRLAVERDPAWPSRSWQADRLALLNRALDRENDETQGRTPSRRA